MLRRLDVVCFDHGSRGLQKQALLLLHRGFSTRGFASSSMSSSMSSSVSLHASKPWSRLPSGVKKQDGGAGLKNNVGVGWETHAFTFVVSGIFVYYFRDSISYALASEQTRRRRDDAKWRKKIDGAPDEVKQMRRDAVANVVNGTHSFAMHRDPFTGMSPEDIVKFVDVVRKEEGISSGDGDDPYEGLSPEEINKLIEQRSSK